MFGVRVMNGRQIIDLKVFRALDDAREWRRKADHGNYDTASIFEVCGATDVRDAAAAIRKRDSSRIELIDTEESAALIKSRLERAEHKARKEYMAFEKARRQFQSDHLIELEAASEAMMTALNRVRQ